LSNPNSITRIITAILLASTIIVILFVGIQDNMNIAYAGGDDSGTSIIDVSSAQVFKEIQNCGTKGIAIWCV
jgi:ABC-type cobalt transport system substrate-binding protein